METRLYLPKEQLDAAQKILANPFFQNLLEVVKARAPAQPSVTSAPNQQIAEAFLRQGYEQALVAFLSVPYEQEPDEIIRPAYDHRD